MKIVLALAVTLLLIGCSEETPTQAQAGKEITQSIDKIAKVVKEESVKISKSVEKVTQESVQTVSNKAEEVTQKTKKVAQKTVVAIDKVLEEPKIVEEKVSIDAKALFAKCSSCHGIDGDKKALNKSQSIKGWSVTKLTAAINGYKDGSYGGSMKGVMKPQINKLSDDEIKALSEYISKL
ncbi:MAG TPA: c-type cytochrome [Sulfurimonas sp.]|nr:c-type cytochrome [Sulfurimonas sp.]